MKFRLRTTRVERAVLQAWHLVERVRLHRLRFILKRSLSHAWLSSARYAHQVREVAAEKKGRRGRDRWGRDGRLHLNAQENYLYSLLHPAGTIMRVGCCSCRRSRRRAVLLAATIILKTFRSSIFSKFFPTNNVLRYHISYDLLSR